MTYLSSDWWSTGGTASKSVASLIGRQRAYNSYNQQVSRYNNAVISNVASQEQGLSTMLSNLQKQNKKADFSNTKYYLLGSIAVVGIIAVIAGYKT